jgi:Asp-tRNA(Asn)/Glu-tRNA(Gln) amidotransferase A subunit family amidase
LIPAVEYVQANRARTLLMRQVARLLEDIDVFVAPSLHDMVLMLTNLTGHPSAVVPNGFVDEGSPASISFVGNLYKDAETLAVANAYQRMTKFHLRHPPRFSARLTVAP